MSAPGVISPLWLAADPLVLASRSQGRIALLAAAGIPLDIAPVELDERALEAEVVGASGRGGREAGPESGDAGAVALELASAKARLCSRDRPDRWVVGADQTLWCRNRLLHKPADRREAAEHLALMSGRVHELHSAAAVARNGREEFRTVQTARLAVRPLSPAMIERYLDAAGPAVQSSAGAYLMEGLGVHLFDGIEGDHFTILGLPLLPLLAFFRQAGLVAA